MSAKSRAPGVQLASPKVPLAALVLVFSVAAGFLGIWEMKVGSWNVIAAKLSQSGDVTFRIIVVSSGDRAAQIAVRLKQGEDFAKLAQAESLESLSGAGRAHRSDRAL